MLFFLVEYVNGPGAKEDYNSDNLVFLAIAYSISTYDSYGKSVEYTYFNFSS